MAEENAGAEGADDVEAEMLRMMEEEMTGEGEGEAGAGAEAESGSDDSAGDIDSLLEQEMLKAMEEEGGDADAGASGGSVAAFSPQMPALVDDDYDGIDRLTDVAVEVTVEIGESLIPIQDIMTWASGSVVELTPQEHEPVNILLNGRMFARGEVVVIEDTFGVRITELLDLSEDGARH